MDQSETIRIGPDGSAEAVVDAGLFSGEAVLKTTYLFTGRVFAEITGPKDGRLVVRLSARSPGVDVRAVAREFLNELVDQELRARLKAEFGPVERRIVEEAFAPLADAKAAKPA